MKIVKYLAVALVAYVALVATFETMIGVIQPTAGETLVITTTDDGGNANDRVLARLETDGRIYVAANHWPRAWYRQALANPNVDATIEGVRAAYTAVPCDEAESARVHGEHNPGIAFRVLTGFPPRLFLRLDPKTAPRT